jgi:hypothetical protein
MDQQYISMSLERYEELLQKEFLANSILNMNDINEISIAFIKKMKENYEKTANK